MKSKMIRLASLAVVLLLWTSVECATIKRLETVNIDSMRLGAAHEEHKRARRAGNLAHVIKLDITPELKCRLVHQLPLFGKRFMAEAMTEQGAVPIRLDKDIWYHGTVEGESSAFGVSYMKINAGFDCSTY